MLIALVNEVVLTLPLEQPAPVGRVPNAERCVTTGCGHDHAGTGSGRDLLTDLTVVNDSVAHDR